MIKEKWARLTSTQKKSLILVPVLGLLVALPFVAVWAVEEAKEHEVQGVVEALPAHRTGVWQIGGRQLTANAQTEFKEKKCALKAGTLAEAEYKADGQTLVAEEIKCQTEAEIKGVVQVMPVNRIGVWKIAGQTVTATAETRFKDKSCPLKTGSLIEAEVRASSQGLILEKLECEEDDD